MPPGSEDKRVLQSSSHSLFGFPASLESKYLREEEIGRGGNAVIYRVKCLETGKHFACKTLRKVNLYGGFMIYLCWSPFNLVVDTIPAVLTSDPEAQLTNKKFLMQPPWASNSAW